MKKILAAAIAALTIVTPAQAAPTYLTCTLTESASEVAGRATSTSATPLVVELTLNEDQQTASYYLPSTGYTKRLGATFQRGVITFASEDRSSSMNSSDSWSLDRGNGTITRQTQIYSAHSPVKLMDKTGVGKCRKAAAPGQLF